MDVKKLLKVYNYVNDERRWRINFKFVGALAALLVSGVALAGFALVQSPAASGPGGSGGGDGPVAASEPKSDYVGLSEIELAAGQLDAGAAEDRLAAYRAEHPDRVIDDVEEVRSGGVVIGFRLTYHEP